MFKFARYFFLVFILTIITPLVLLFLWNHSQMEGFKHKMDKYMLEMHIDKLKEKIAIHINSETNIYLDKNGFQNCKAGVKTLKTDSQMNFQPIEKFDYKKLHPGGPILLEIYKGDSLEEKNLLARIHPEMIGEKPPPFFEEHRKDGHSPPHMRGHHSPRMKEDRPMPNKNYQLTDSNGKPILLFSLKLLGHPEKHFMEEKMLALQSAIFS